MTATDQLRAALRDLEAKARELELDKKLESMADQADHLLREAAVKAGDYAHDNRGRVEGAFDRAGSTVDEKTDGKYARYVEKLRTGVLLGVDWVAEQRESTATPSWAPTNRYGHEPEATPAATPADAPTDTPEGSPTSAAWVDVTDTPADAPTHTPADAPTDTPADLPEGSATSDAWVDVTDPAPTAEGPADPK